MNKVFLKTAAAVLAVNTVFCAVYAKDSMFGERDEWLTAQDYIDDVYKYDLNSSAESGQNVYSDAVTDIIALGIMKTDDKGNFAENAVMTRSELALVINKIRYGDDSYLKSGHENYGNSDKVTLSDGIKSMVELLGYGVDALAYSKDGELFAAQKLGILKSVDVSNTERFLTKGDLALMIYNSFGVNIQTETIERDTKKYSVKKSDILNEYMDIVRTEGILSGIHGVNLFSNAAVREGTVEIDRALYYTGNNYSALFGKRVVSYAKKDNADADAYTIVFLRELTGKRASVEYSFDTGDNLTVNSGKLEFENSDGSADIYYYSDFKYAMFNGDIIEPAETESLLKSNQTGKIIISSSGKNTGFDTIVVKSYANYHVKYFNAEDKRITPDYGLAYIELPEKTVINTTDETGRKLNFSDISQKCVISMFKNSSGSYCDIIVSNAKVNGTVISSENDKITLDNGITYPIDNIYKNAPDKAEIKLNSTGTFYITANGRVAGFSSGGEAVWAILYAVGTKSELDRFDGKYSVKLFDSTGAWQEYSFAKKLTVDGEAPVSSENAAALITPYINDLIRFKINGKNEVTFIDTAKDNAAENTDKDRVSHDSSWDLKYTSNWSKGFSWKYNGKQVPYHIMSQTVVFSVPTDIKKERLYAVKSNSMFTEGSTYNIKFYSPDDMLCCAAAVVTLRSAAASGNDSFQGSTLLGIEKVLRGVNEDGESVYTIEGWEWRNSPKKVSVALPANFLDENEEPRIGCVYRFQRDGTGAGYEKLDMLVDSGNIPDGINVNAGGTHERMTGTIESFNSSMIKIRLSDGSQSSWQTNLNGSYMIYNKATQKFYQATYADLYVGEKIYLYGAVENAGGMLVCR